VTHYEVIKLFNGYLAVYIRPYSIPLYYILSRGVALYCTCTAAFLSLWCLCTLFILPYYFHRTFNNYTGGQSVSFVLLWQPSDGIDLFVSDYVFLCYSRKVNTMMMEVPHCIWACQRPQIDDIKQRHVCSYFCLSFSAVAWVTGRASGL